MISKPGAFGNLGRARQEVPTYWLRDIRHKGGVTLFQAVVRNVGTCRIDEKE